MISNRSTPSAAARWETSDMTETMDEMISHLAAAEGVLRFEIMAG